VAVLFRPPGEVRPHHRALLPLDDLGRAMLPDGDEVTDNSIVEFSYDSGNDDSGNDDSGNDDSGNDDSGNDDSGGGGGGGWVPLRVRHDKTKRYIVSGELGGAVNDVKSAYGTWESIRRPVTEAMLMGKDAGALQEEFAADRDTSRYYVNKDKRETSQLLAMRHFHNAWVKERFLLHTFSGRVASLFDVGSGRGGDIQKWTQMRDLERVLGVDLVEDSIVSGGDDGAYVRLAKEHARRHAAGQPMPVVVFLPMDASRRIEGTTAALEAQLPDPDNLYVARVLWAQLPLESVSEPRLRQLHGFAVQPFDMVSCQFAIHYFFETKATLRTFAANVARVLAPGGYFVGTCLDGQKVDAALSDSGEAGSLSAMGEDGRVLWHIGRRYEGRLGDRPVQERVGLKVRVYVETIGQSLDEYLVDYTLLEMAMEEAGLRPVGREAQQELGLGASTGGFEGLFHDMQEFVAGEDGKSKDPRLSQALQMTEAQRRYSFLNRWFVFRKSPNNDAASDGVA